MLSSLQHQSSGGHLAAGGGPGGLPYDPSGQTHLPRGPAHPADEGVHHPPPLHHGAPHHEALYGNASHHHHPGEGQPEEGGMVVPHPGMHASAYPEGLQFAYPPPQATGDGSVQYPFNMGLGSLQLAQMGGILQGQQYALMPSSEDAVYVNQKQYHRILKRRQARMKLEAKFKITPRKEWLHDSRHQHAKNRQRGPGGRFLSKDERERYAQNPEGSPSEKGESKNASADGSPSSSSSGYENS